MLRCTAATSNAYSPSRATERSAGIDLYSAYEYYIRPGGRVLVSTDLKIAIPDGCYGRIAPRSGLAVYDSIDVGAGVIDADYRGVVYVLLINNGTKVFRVHPSMRVAQLILEKIVYAKPIMVPSLDQTDRDEAGLGSTGI